MRVIHATLRRGAVAMAALLATSAGALAIAAPADKTATWPATKSAVSPDRET